MNEEGRWKGVVESEKKKKKRSYGPSLKLTIPNDEGAKIREEKRNNRGVLEKEEEEGLLAQKLRTPLGCALPQSRSSLSSPIAVSTISIDTNREGLRADCKQMMTPVFMLIRETTQIN
uniref:Uncharacterized protein n=1 Tax=Caenorhabditis tropicalis TaxID=1561998 RepID=A0A1I7TJT9_9PELO